jgi:hypothetical protein
MSGYGTLEPVDVAPHEAAHETLLSFTAMQQFSDLDRISRQGCSFSNRPQAVSQRDLENIKSSSLSNQPSGFQNCCA